jgi:ABC-type Fe3+-hydroxamate transport system substrate-binding protein
VSFVSSATETLFELGCGAAVAGVTPYCARYVEGLAAPVVGDYLKADLGALKALRPDLVLVTLGIQAAFARRMAAAGLPVYALPLPASRHGILENQLTVGALMHRSHEARRLNDQMEEGFAALRAARPLRRPRVYTELWFGAHVRSIGALTFIHDLVELAGGEPVPASATGAYPALDLSAAAAARPEAMLLFQEPEVPVDGPALLRERGWGALPIIGSDVSKGRNIIHDGPSYLDTARWLQEALRGL